MSLGIQMKVARPAKRRLGPLWLGPSASGDLGGVSQSMLGRYMSCKERFRVEFIEGLRPADTLNAKIEFGNMWHVCEEALALGQPWEDSLRNHALGLCRKYPLQQGEISDCMEKVRITFPAYVKHWSEHPDVKNRTPLLAEAVFDVPYKLPSGRTVRLRGKWDGVDLTGNGKTRGVWLFETKTKSTIDRAKLERQLTFDTQTMLYMIALSVYDDDSFWQAVRDSLPGQGRKPPILGVRYNVVRRSAHVQKKKSREDFAQYLGGMIREDLAASPNDNGWFARWNCTVSPADVETFKRTCLDPVLENLCDDYEWWLRCMEGTGEFKVDPFDGEYRSKHFPHHSPRHFRTPYFYSSIADGGFGDVDNYLDNGSTVGLQRAETLFDELKPQGDPCLK